MIFQKSSTRTRVSFETGMYQLGGQALFLSSRDLQIGRGEPVQDTARVLSRYLDGIMIRTFAQKEVEDLAEYGSIPIINGLTDYCHPCQVLADLMTVREYQGEPGRAEALLRRRRQQHGKLPYRRRPYRGDEGVHRLPGQPPSGPRRAEIRRGLWGQVRRLSADIPAMAADADVLYTDVWASMGQEGGGRRARGRFSPGIRSTTPLWRRPIPDAMVLHCLPAHREEEITGKVFEEHAGEIFDEAENRLHAQKAVMVKLMEKH